MARAEEARSATREAARGRRRPGRDPLVRSGHPADRAGNRPRLGAGHQARRPVPDDRPLRRRPCRLPRAWPVRPRHAPAVLLAGARQRRPAGAAAGHGRRQLPGNDPAHQPEHRPQHRGQGEPARRPLRAEGRDRPRPDAVARGSRRAAHGRELRRAPGNGHDRARARDRRRRHLRGPRAGARPARDAPPRGRASGAGDVPLRRSRRSPALDPSALQRAGRRDRAGRSASGRIRRRGLVASPLDLAACSRPAAGAALGRVGDLHRRREGGRQSGRAVPGSAPDRRGRAERRVPRLDAEHGRGGHRPRAVQPYRVALDRRPPAADQRDAGRG